MAQSIESCLSLTPALFAVADPATGEFRWLSERWESLLGHSMDELLGTPFIDFVHPDDVAATREATARLETGLSVVHFYNRYSVSGGGWRHLMWYAGVHDKQIYAVAHDITDAPEDSGKFEERQRLLELVEDLSGVGHWSVDLLTNEVYWSRQVFQIHGLERNAAQPSVEEAIGFYHPEDRQQIEEHFAEGVSAGLPVNFEHRLVLGDGSIRWVKVRGHVRRDRKKPVSLFGVIEDITERRLETQAQVERAVGIETLTAGIAHEINNPLTSVMANLERLDELIQRPDVAVADLRKLVGNALKSSEQVGRIVRDLRAFMLPREVPAVAIRLVDLIEAALNMTRAELRQHAILDTDLHPTASVFGVESELIQVLVNILQNAGYAVRESQGGRIAVRTHQTGQLVHIEIEDNGPGVPSESLARLCEPFYTTKPIGEGTGLGLYVSRNIVEKYDGQLRVDSMPGRTVFSIELPAYVDMSASESDVERARVLVVDDERSITDIISEVLAVDFEVDISADAEGAMRRMQYRRYDVLITDISMPGDSGWDLLRAVRGTQPALFASSLVITGGHGSVPADLTAVPVIEKPFSLSELRKSVAEVLRR